MDSPQCQVSTEKSQFEGRKWSTAVTTQKTGFVLGHHYVSDGCAIGWKIIEGKDKKKTKEIMSQIIKHIHFLHLFRLYVHKG